MSQWDRVQKLFQQVYGEDWQKPVTLDINADTFSWFIMLVEQGIKAQKKIWQKNKLLDACAIASLQNWKTDLEKLVSDLENKLK